MFDRMRALAAVACLVIGTSSAASAQTNAGARGKPGAASSHFNTGSSTIHTPSPPAQPAAPAPVPPAPVARPH